MFHKARKELHKHLKRYVFTLVTKSVTIPPDCVVGGGEVSHYYTTSDELVIGSRKKSGSVWVKKKARSRHHQLGPVVLTSSNALPKPGDVLFGELLQVSGSERKFGKQTFKEERQAYKWWICPGAPVYYLATMVLQGTSETEESLRSLLKLEDNYDDLWMLARLVLFNNIQCFVDMLDRDIQSKQCIKLRHEPAVFIQQLSMWLSDFSVLTEFQKRAPVASIPEPASASGTTLEPLSAAEPLPVKKFVGRKRRHDVHADSKQEEYDPDEPSYNEPSYNGPSYFDFSHRQPAGPTSYYRPSTPPCSPTPLGTPPSFRRDAPPPFFSNTPPGTPPYAPLTPPHM